MNYTKNIDMGDNYVVSSKRYKCAYNNYIYMYAGAASAAQTGSNVPSTGYALLFQGNVLKLYKTGAVKATSATLSLDNTSIFAIEVNGNTVKGVAYNTEGTEQASISFTDDSPITSGYCGYIFNSVRYPQIYDYCGIWMEDITHTTARGSNAFTLSSTNKLLKQYPYTTGLKTGSTSKAKFCVSATARKNEIDLIAVVMGCENGKTRFAEAVTLLNYGFSVCNLFRDENDFELENLPIKGALKEDVSIAFKEPFVYLDVENKDLSGIQKTLELPEFVEAPVEEGDVAGFAVYTLKGKEIGRTEIVFNESMEKAGFMDYFRKALEQMFF